MIRIFIALLFAYLCLQLFIILKNNNVKRKNRVKSKFRPPSKDNVKDAEFEDSK